MAAGSSLRTFREVILWPALAAGLPWPKGFALLNAIAARGRIYPETTAEAVAGAKEVAPIADETDWKRRYRLTRLVDHCDLFLYRTRGPRWFERYVDVEGEWPPKGPFIAMTFHWGAGLWALAQIKAGGVAAQLVTAGFDKTQFRDDALGYRYALTRNRTVEMAGGAPVIYTGRAATLFQIRIALSRGHAVVALYDIPATMTARTLRTTVCDRVVELPAGMASLAAQAGVPVIAFSMGLDYESGRRRLRIEPAFVPSSAQDFADRLGNSMTRLLAEDTAAWHFSGLASQFFSRPPTRSPMATPIPRADQA
ncbi:MAG: hypothetical protein ABJB04_03995 [Betaproteobacteria bacterium]